MKIRMRFKKSTKGTHVFAQVDEDGRIETLNASIPTLYIRKSALKDPAKFINITVEIEK